MAVLRAMVRVLIAKPGLDGHDTGAKVVARALRDAGMEVIYSGLHRTIDEIVAIAEQEDVDVIGLSILSGAHISMVQRLKGRLERVGLGEVPVVVGGTIPSRDRAVLMEMGVRAVFPPGSKLEEIVSTVRKLGEEYRRRSGKALPNGRS